MNDHVSPRRRREVIDALRRGTVPAKGLDLLAVGLERFIPALDADLDAVAGGGSAFKAVRGEYGAGKTFVTRYVAERALRRGFASAEVQISETETPLHKLETIYRRVGEALRTAAFPPSALRPVLDSWLFTLESDATAADPGLAGRGQAAVDQAVEGLLEQRLAAVSVRTPAFAQALRAYRSAVTAGDGAAADALAAWLGGQPHVAAAAKRGAGIRGELDHFGAMGFLQGLLEVLRDAGHPGLLLVLDEVETLQRVRGDVRDKALNALRQLLDEIDAGRYPGLFLVITGTPAFYDGPSGVPRQRILGEPPDVLLTTPESLEAMLISHKVEHGRLFTDLRAIVVDEVHAFAGDDRGWHLLAVLERLTRVAGRPIQRIGLSATVGNPAGLLDWLQGAGKEDRSAVVVSPDLAAAAPAVPGGATAPPGDIELDYVGSVSNAATVIASLHRGEKRLVFCDSRQQLVPFDRSAEPILRHLIQQGFIDQDGELLFIGPAAEQRFGYRHFMGMTAVFTAPPQFTVLTGRQEVGRTDPMLLTEKTDGPRLLLLGGRSWRVTWTDWKRRRCYVEPVPSGGKARWLAPGVSGASFALARAAREVLLGVDPPVALTQRAKRTLADIRGEHVPTVHPGGNVIVRAGADVRWWTWAGYRANATLAATLSGLIDDVQRFDDASIRMRADLTHEMWKAGSANAAERLCLPDVDQRALAGLKFNEAVPERLATATLAARLADLDSAARVLIEPTRFTVVDDLSS